MEAFAGFGEGDGERGARTRAFAVGGDIGKWLRSHARTHAREERVHGSFHFHHGGGSGQLMGCRNN